MATSETAPLLSGGDNSSYYFIKQENHLGGTTEAVRDSDGGQVVEGIPRGANADEFAPRVIGAKSPKVERPDSSKKNHGGGGLFSKWFGSKKSERSGAGTVPSLVKQRKAPIKIEPKVFFANERTFLAWMHISVILAGASIAILAFADSDENPASQLYGIVLLPVAMAFIVYSMHQYARRAFMIRTKHPGPYEDTVGPTVLGIMLMLSIVCQFAIKLYSMS